MNAEQNFIKYESFLRDNTIFLPLDQRYSKQDILYIISVVIELLSLKK